MSLRFVLLGLLAENSDHGYGLRRQFAGSLGHFRKINEGQLYTELAKMEKEGLIEREVYVPEKGPARKIFHITSTGKGVFMDWLLSGMYEDGGVLFDFMQGYSFFSKCTFFKHMKSKEVLGKIDAQISIAEGKKKAYEEILVNMKQRKVDRFRVRILGFGLEQMDHRIRWLNDLKKDVGGEVGVKGAK